MEVYPSASGSDNVSVIRLESVSKDYGTGGSRIRAVDSVSLEIQKGDFLTVMGPSGSGKTTLLNLIGCLDKPTGGHIFIEDSEISSMTDDELAYLRNARIGFIFQTFNLIPRMSVLKNILLPTRFSPHKKKEREEKALALVKKLGLEGKEVRTPNELSGGERQRVALARALMNDPDIILADEPTGNVDSSMEKQIMEILSDLNKKGQTIVVITHSDAVSKYGKRIIHMLDGKIVHEGGA